MTTSTDVAIVGLHGGTWYGPAAEVALRKADLLVGSARQHDDLAAVQLPGERIELWGDLDEVAELCLRRSDAGDQVCVLAAGDPGFFGIVRVLAARLGTERLRVHPAPSSISLAFARIGIPWDDAVVASCHGRSVDDAAATVLGHHKVAVLVSPASPPEVLGQAVRRLDSTTERDVWVCSRLGDDEESITRTDLAGLVGATFDGLSVVVFVRPGQAVAPFAASRWGAPETTFDHRDGLITKSEVRAVVLAKLQLPATGVLWDVGAGSGSVGIEAARLVPGLRVFAIEHDEESCERIRTNGRGTAVSVVHGDAPEAFADLPDPDRLFVGGGGSEVLERALLRLRPGGVAVATYATIGPALAAASTLGSIVQVQINRGVPVGPARELRLAAENPVFVTWGTRP